MKTADDRLILLARLNRLGGQLRVLALLTGLAGVLAWWLPLLVLLAWADWLWDLYEEVPAWGRILLTASAWVSLAFLASRRLASAFRAPGVAHVANLVERQCPEFDFRLVTSAQVEATDPFARQVAGEASRLAQNRDWSGVLDTRPLLALMRPLVPIASAIVLLGILHPLTASALACRLALMANTPIPRATTILGESVIIFPQGEPIQINYGWEGSPPPHGSLRWRGADGLKLDSPLVMSGKFLTGVLPPDAGDGEIWAWAGDGRHGPARIQRQMRPMPVLARARALLPAWRGTTPSGSRYSLDLADGEAEALAGSGIEVSFDAGTPLTRCQVTVIPQGESAGDRVLPGKVTGSGGLIQFTLAGGDSRYEIQAVSLEGLESRPPLIRRCRPLPEDPPQIAWIAEHIQGIRSESDDDLDGLPVVIGTQFRVAYRASSPAGISRAEFHYRIQNKTDWRVIKLGETAAKPEWGPFDARLGQFSRLGGQVFDFFTPPPQDPEKIPGRGDAWGRFDFHIEGLAELRLADRIEYKVVATDLRPQPLVGESEARVKEVVGVEDLLAWLRRREREQEKLRQLRLDQLGVFPDRPANRSGS